MTTPDTVPVFLVVIDESEEMHAALRYAAWHARQTRGRVGMLHVIELEDGIQPWESVEEALTGDAEAQAREKLATHSKFVETISEMKPVWFVRRSRRREALLKLLEEEPGISLLVLAAKKGGDDPGPLVSYLTSGKGLRALKIPLVIVPESFQIPEPRNLKRRKEDI